MDTNAALMDKFINSVDWDWLNHSGCFSEEDYYEVSRYVDPDDFNCASGATKLVLIPCEEQEPYVIKIPFTKLYSDDAYDEENDCYGAYVDLEGAPFGYGFDYCHAEEVLVARAKEFGIGDFFPETEIYQANPFPVYIQEKCEVMYNHRSKTRTPAEIHQGTHNLEQNASPVQADWLDTFADSWLLDAVEWYGETKLFQLFDFLTMYGISDFHSANYGYAVGDHRPVLIDFSGFNEAY